MNTIVNTLILILIALGSYGQSSFESHKVILKLMGTKFEITATADTKAKAIEAVNIGVDEIRRIESLISSWKETSETSLINRNAGIKPVHVSKELFDLINRSKKISNLTKGAFDISFAGMAQLYQFDKLEHELPSIKKRIQSTEMVSWESIKLDNIDQTVFLEKEGMRIGFGGIGKGYAANKAKAAMREKNGVKGGVVNASGDLVVWGENNTNEGWSIQISDPKNIDKSLGWLNINNASVVTSGNYEKFFTNEGKRYAHIIDPTTGLPTTGIKSATVVSPDAELGDALATSLFVLGVHKGIALINSLKNVEALIITDQDELFTSNNLKLNKY